jgi:formylglycine-generating enzyme required for sulfatase activity
VGVAFLILAVLGVTGRLNRFIYQPVDMEDYWVTIPAGEFLMGSSQENIEYAQSLCSDCDFSNEQPQHSVFLDEYQIGKYEVTNNQYNQCIHAGKCVGSVVISKLDHPMINVNWYAAKTYCEWVGGRLPTEAEWEKAASWDYGAKRKRTYSWGEMIDCTYANYDGKNGGGKHCFGDTAPVGNYESGKSPYGLYDMAGNVWEWVNDWYSDTYYQSSPSSNPLGPDIGQYRVLRGGAWYNLNYVVRSAFRGWYDPSIADNHFGFRCSR